MAPHENPVEPTAAFPAPIMQVAGERGLGAPMIARREAGGLPSFLMGAAVAGGSIALLLAVGAVGEATDASPLSGLYSVLRFVALFFFFSFVWGTLHALRAAIVGTRVTYLFAGGLVHRRRRGLRVVSWSEVDVLQSVIDKRTQGKEGKVLGYRVKPTEGKDFVIPLLLVDGRDTFIDRIVAELSAVGRPVR